MTEPPKKAPETLKDDAADDAPDAARPLSDHDDAGRDASDISARAREEAARLAAEFRDAASELSSRLKSLPKAAGQILPSPKRVAGPTRPPEPIRLGGAAPVGPVAGAGKAETENAESPVAATSGMHNAPAGEPASGDDDKTSTTTSAGSGASSGREAELSALKRPGAKPSAAERARARRSQSATKPALTTTRAAKQAGKNPASPKRPPLKIAALAREIALPLTSLGFIGLIGGLYLTFVVLAPRPPEGVDLWAVNRLPSVV
ncbi:MAG: hypothetical protein KDA46_03565, partial [Parvularculaceae bacterium]|nr:hypothetical protein [Parvularculaceae bacterium]